MNKIQETLQKLKTEVEKLLQSIEGSTFFEKIMARYDGLELRQQKGIKSALAVLVGFCLVLLFSWPIWNAIGQRNRIREYRNLIADIRGLGQKERMKVLSTQFPEGAAKLPVSSLDETEMSLEQFLANIGIPVEFYKLTKSGSGFDLSVEELSVKQLQFFIFQIDSWYPNIGFNSLKTQVHPDSKAMLKMSASIYFGNPSPSGEDMAFGDVDEGEGMTSPSSSITEPDYGGNSGSASDEGSVIPPAPPQDFVNPDSGDFEPPPPPPLPPEFDEGAPPEGDLPPPAFFEED